ncbi:hypothetical protein HID58_022623 [Brassica napus]|uniref:Uncharacterized protein n=1 Tax=Brassica napus TaxID=3708 RepID=A0ABQ8CZS9_BRANA|nr:hypothetical protein HID58_022623 [Brassica napus]
MASSSSISAMNELEQQWRPNQVSRIVLENLGIKHPSCLNSTDANQAQRLINDTHPTPRRFPLPIKGKQRKFSIMANSSVLLGDLKTGGCSSTVHLLTETVSRLVHWLCNQNFRLSDLLLTVQYGDSTNLDVQNEPDSHIPEEGFRFGDHDSLLGLANTNTHLLVCLTHKRSLFTRNLKVVVASSIYPKMVGRRLFLNATSGTHVFFDKETDAEARHDQSKQNTFRSRFLIYST